MDLTCTVQLQSPFALPMFILLASFLIERRPFLRTQLSEFDASCIPPILVASLPTLALENELRLLVAFPPLKARILCMVRMPPAMGVQVDVLHIQAGILEMHVPIVLEN